MFRGNYIGIMLALLGSTLAIYALAMMYIAGRPSGWQIETGQDYKARGYINLCRSQQGQTLIEETDTGYLIQCRDPQVEQQEVK